MRELGFFLEELSARVMLEGFFAENIAIRNHPRFIVFEGKQDLEKQLLRRLRGYNVPNAKFIILRDKDSGDCRVIKNVSCNFVVPVRKRFLIRIACHELESWYLADLKAVEAGLGMPNLSRWQLKYADPDQVSSPSRLLENLVAYQKVGGSRAIGPHLDPENQRSESFSAFVQGIKKLL